MALYVGEAVRIRASAKDPESGDPLDPPPDSAIVDFWKPGRNPKSDPSVRSTPDVSGQAMTYRPLTDDFILYQSTSGSPWEDGKWSYRVVVTGTTYTNWEFGTFTLKP